MDQESLSRYTEKSLFGRYITLDHIEPLLKSQTIGQLAIIGQSVENSPLYALTVGIGATKILAWSQMHGNESTATKALFDLLNLLADESALAHGLLHNFTFCFVPMLNPDGAARYTRENAAEADLNRDFVGLLQPETRALVKLFAEFEPNYCFNLHDQRTIFGAGDTGKPATISFLAPAYNENCEWNESRLKALAVINAMNRQLQKVIPGQVGRFDDTFNINCAGDNFQLRNVPTILVEAGHFPDDYNREITRKHFFSALLSGFRFICENDIVGNGIDEYLNIPQNKKVFYDFVYKNIRINYDGIEIITNFAVQYSEELHGNEMAFVAKISAIGNLEGFFGHYTFDGHQNLFKAEYGSSPIIDMPADFCIGELQFSNGMPQY